MAEIAVGLALGLVVGLTLSMMGAGGSIITVPALVFITDLPVHEATGTALLVVVGLAVVGGVSHYRRGATMPKMAAAVGLSGIGGSIAGAWLNQRADEDLILLFLALLMIVAGARMLQGAVGRGGETDGELAARPASSRLVLGAAAGSVLGLLTGFFGLGGGFLIVPLLVVVLGLPMRLAVGTSLLVISMHAGAGLIGHLSFGNVDFGAAAPFLGGGLVGAVVGSRFSGRIRENWHRIVFSMLLFSVAGLLLARSFD